MQTPNHYFVVILSQITLLMKLLLQDATHTRLRYGANTPTFDASLPARRQNGDRCIPIPGMTIAS